MDIYEKLEILADSAKFDVSCSTSGTKRSNNGKIGNVVQEGICHAWSADGRCISLLKVLFSNKCVYDCQYCVNRRSTDCRRAAFEPEEIAKLTIEFYRRNYIEGLFLSSAVEISPDYTMERMIEALRILRYDYGFAGYIHAKIIPGASPELVEKIGCIADRLSVNIELPTEKSLKLLAPQKKADEIFKPMKQITNTLIERNGLIGPGTMFKGQKLNTDEHYIKNAGMKLEDSADKYGKTAFLKPISADRFAVSASLADNTSAVSSVLSRGHSKNNLFAPAGQTTQMIIGASGETDRQILKLSEDMYRIFKMKRVFFSAYIAVSDSPVLPDAGSAPPLAREHRMYQADWLLRFYGFKVDELLDDEHPFLDPELDPKVSWALRNIHRFPMEVNKASLEELLRIPGIGVKSAYRILRQRRVSSVKYEDLRKMGVALKRTKYFLTCAGKYYGTARFEPEDIRGDMLGINEEEQLSMFAPTGKQIARGANPWNNVAKDKAAVITGL
ncbi:MAG: putative DNA modification/repair radical SAM protein [Firmicutes bacterium]|nr:putative DNA modification/repair radical SAM protein [Bacillota bacterium]